MRPTEVAAVRRPRPSRWAVVLATAAVALAGCGGAPGPAAGVAAGGPPVSGGELRFRVAADEGCVDPQQQQLRASLGASRQIVDSLTFQHEAGEVVPWLAESWQVTDDSTTYTFRLREGVTFSDGSPLDAGVVKANVDGLVQMGAAAIVAAPYLRGFQGAEATDARTIVIRFGQPNAQFLQATSTVSMGMLSAATVARPLGERCTGQVTGTGPFVLDRYVANEGMRLTRRVGYGWSPEGFANRGESHLDAVDFRFVPSGSVGTGQLLSGQIDVIADIPPEDVPRLQAEATVTERQNPGFPASFFVNSSRGPLAEAAVRQAISSGLDRQQLVTTTLSPIDVPATGLLSATTPGFTASAEELAHDPARATALLEQAGWMPGPDGIRHKAGQRLSVRVNYMIPAQTPNVPFLELARQQLAAVGVDLVLNPLTTAEEREARVSGEFELRFNGQSRGDPDVLASLLAGIDPALDELLGAQAAEADPVARFAIVAQASELALTQAYSIPLYDLKLPLAHSPAVQGLVFDNTNTVSLAATWLSGR